MKGIHIKRKWRTIAQWQTLASPRSLWLSYSPVYIAGSVQYGPLSHISHRQRFKNKAAVKKNYSFRPATDCYYIILSSSTFSNPEFIQNKYGCSVCNVANSRITAVICTKQEELFPIWNAVTLFDGDTSTCQKEWQAAAVNYWQERTCDSSKNGGKRSIAQVTLTVHVRACACCSGGMHVCLSTTLKS